MFQDFDTHADPSQGGARLSRLRAEMARTGVDGFVVPLSDAHQGEYVAPCDARLEWLTGFGGSAGFTVVLADAAPIFVDGRYTVQVRHQVDLAHFTPVDWPATTLPDWLKTQGVRGQIAYDPWLHTVADVEGWARALDGSGIEMVARDNLVDAIWEDRPARPAEPIRIQPDAFTGRSHGEKRQALAADLRAAGHAGAIITLTDAVCWLLNIRGADIPRNPIVHAFAMLNADETVDLFTDAPASDAVRAHLGDAVRLHPRDALIAHLERAEGPVRIDPKTGPAAVQALLQQPVHGPDPCALPKARKTDAEIEGARAAHLRDGAAMVRFLQWLDGAMADGITEIDAATRLEQERRATNALLDLSFNTISSTGPNGAINHYRVTHETNRTLKEGELFLIDSGGQYQDGTTDITRTIPVGAPSDLHRACYTRVLQGVIALSEARFPRGVAGAHLDALARAPLWAAGLDFDHGTGHGVGSYLCVHEGPQRISRASDVPLEPGMIVSNEPGYYREGDFGIRLENLIVVREAPTLAGQDARPWLDFETLTFVPFDRRLIDTSLLTDAEKGWIDAYHRATKDKIGSLLEGPARDWLDQACAPL